MTYEDQILSKLADLIRRGRFAELETERLEIKPVPPDAASWKERQKSVNAFLNTRGGILLLGVKEEGSGAEKKYVLTGWKDHAEPNLKELSRCFTDRKGVVIDLGEYFRPMEIRTVLDQRVALVYVDELPADRKFVFLEKTAYKRMLTGDHKITEQEVERQEEFKEEAVSAKELQLVSDMSEADLDLKKLNHFIFHLNQPREVETLKPDLDSARPFLARKCFTKEGNVTILGALVCGNHPGDRLGFRSQVHGYVDIPQQVAQDKQDFIDNVLQLMESSYGYLLRNIQVGVSSAGGGTSLPEYPEDVLRETVNNALAHRDYSVNKHVIIAIRPGKHFSIQNPGKFRNTLLIEDDSDIPIRRILPEAKPRNPKLADVLRVYRKWEGRGIGMATLVSMCLENRIDLPYFRIYTEEVKLFVCGGKLLDDRMMRLFDSFDRFISDRLDGGSLSNDQKLVLSYLIKSEWANESVQHTILLTPDNNHFHVIKDLEKSGLIALHKLSTSVYPIYVADRTLVRQNYVRELKTMFGDSFDELDETAKASLGVVYRHEFFSKIGSASAKQVAFSLWYQSGGSEQDIERFDAFYRKVRYTFNKLHRDGFVSKTESKRYVLVKVFRESNLL